ncbi:hypothetical protein AAZX31_20G074200 [Glycine max]
MTFASSPSSIFDPLHSSSLTFASLSIFHFCSSPFFFTDICILSIFHFRFSPLCADPFLSLLLLLLLFFSFSLLNYNGRRRVFPLQEKVEEYIKAAIFISKTP